VRPTCLLVDDNRNFLEAATRHLMAQGLSVVGCVSTSDEALQFVDDEAPDVALVDLELGSDDGLELVPKLLRRRPDLTVIVISAYGQDDIEELVSGSGAVGFLPKERLSAEGVLALLA
jgi:DNA-binding NarL/FixJ family response regulator